MPDLSEPSSDFPEGLDASAGHRTRSRSTAGTGLAKLASTPIIGVNSRGLSPLVRQWPVISDQQRPVTILIDEELLVAMCDEGNALDDPDVETTIARRLTQGVALAEVVGPEELLWRPVHHDAFEIAVPLSQATIDRLRALADRFGFGVPVLLCTIMYNDACRPWEVRERRAPFAPLRWERGRGNIYSKRFDLPGYQIVFIRLLAGNFRRGDLIVGEALLALARQVQSTGVCGQLPVSTEALEFARKMVRTADFGLA